MARTRHRERERLCCAHRGHYEFLLLSNRCRLFFGLFGQYLVTNESRRTAPIFKGTHACFRRCFQLEHLMKQAVYPLAAVIEILVPIEGEGKEERSGSTRERNIEQALGIIERGARNACIQEQRELFRSKFIELRPNL